MTTFSDLVCVPRFPSDSPYFLDKQRERGLNGHIWQNELIRGFSRLGWREGWSLQDETAKQAPPARAETADGDSPRWPLLPVPCSCLWVVGSGPAQQAAEVVVRKCQSESLEPPTSNSNAKDFILVSELKNCVPDALMTVFIIF